MAVDPLSDGERNLTSRIASASPRSNLQNVQSSSAQQNSFKNDSCIKPERANGLPTSNKKTGTPQFKRDSEIIGTITRGERRRKIQRWLLKRARRRQRPSKARYKGRMRFANARPRVKGRFVKIEFMNKMGLTFDTKKGAWFSLKLQKHFFSADEAVRQVESGSREGETPN